MGTDVTMNISGKQRGHYWLTVQTGMLERGDIDLKGTVSVLNKCVPIEITSKIHIAGQKQNQKALSICNGREKQNYIKLERCVLRANSYFEVPGVGDKCLILII